MAQFRIRHHPRKPFRIYRPPEPNRYYSMGVDVAGGDDSPTSDSSAICVCDAATAEQVAEFQSTWTDPYELADVVMDVGEFYAGKSGQAFCVIEANNMGIATLDRLRRDMGYWNMYSRRVYDKTRNEYVAKVGWLTQTNTREILISKARDTFRRDFRVIRSIALMKEMGAFVYGDDGKPRARAGSHDDLVMAWMLAIQGCEMAAYADPAYAWHEGESKTKEEERHKDTWVHEEVDRLVAAHDAGLSDLGGEDEEDVWESSSVPVYGNFTGW